MQDLVNLFTALATSAFRRKFRLGVREQGYLAEQWVIDHVTAAGFELVAKSEINANPKDGKDHPEGVWTLPPTYRLKDQDRAKYEAIGESDRFTLKFVKR